MPENKIDNQINCTDLSSDEINFQVKNLMFSNCKHIVLRNPNKKNNLLEGLKGSIKIEIIGDVGSNFINNINGPKIIINGSVGDDSACNVQNTKITVFGSCGNNFACGAKNSEFYVFENCGKDSFFNLTASKLIVGGLLGVGSLSRGTSWCAPTIVVMLNLKGGNVFIDIDEEWVKNVKDIIFYLRGEHKATTNKYLIKKTNEDDEDIYLPLISEFARQFNYSLSEIRSKQFCRVNLK